jgi:hypothetical protein
MCTEPHWSGGVPVDGTENDNDYLLVKLSQHFNALSSMERCCWASRSATTTSSTVVSQHRNGLDVLTMGCIFCKDVNYLVLRAPSLYNWIF